MNNIEPNFNTNANIRKLFASEALIRKNKLAFRQYSYGIVKDLPLSMIALDYYINLIKKNDSVRKDHVTPREQHEESHIVTGDIILNIYGNSWIKPKKWGSKDAFFAAIIFHDLIEDYERTGNNLRSILKSGLKKLQIKGKLTNQQFAQANFDIKQTIPIVESLSRKDKDGVRLDGNRIAQAEQWLNHPYAYIIKLIDWCNKLQTMSGLEHFENDGQEKMRKVIRETSLLFVDEKQGFTDRAIDKYPDTANICVALDGIMGMQFQMLDTYREIISGDITFDPNEAHPFNFTKYRNISADLINALPRGNNYISPLLDRFEEKAQTNKHIMGFLNNMIIPSFKEQIRKIDNKARFQPKYAL